MSQLYRFTWFIGFLVFFFRNFLFCSEIQSVYFSTSAAQGEFISISFEKSSPKEKISVRFLDIECPCYQIKESHWECFVGIPADAPIGTQNLNFIVDGSTKTILTAEILSKSFPVETLHLSQEKKSLLHRVDRPLELKKIRAALHTESETFLRDKKFLMPLQGKIEGLYGERRMIEGKLQSGYHRGLDLGALKGTLIKSSNHGTVLLAGKFIEEGNMVMIDHGQGFITAYLHLSKILVRPGQKVKKGDAIGKVGSTGISTSNHLHFGAYIHSTPIDPIYLLKYYEQTLSKSS